MNFVFTLNHLLLVAFALVLMILGLLIAGSKKEGSVRTFKVIFLALWVGMLVLPALFNASFEYAPEMYSVSAAHICLAFLSFALLYGLFFNRAPVTQAMYALCLGIGFPIGLYAFVYPDWVTAANAREFFTTPVDILYFGIPFALIFIPLWLIKTGCYRVRFSDFYKAVIGYVMFASVLMTLDQLGTDPLSFATLGEKVMTDLGLGDLSMDVQHAAPYVLFVIVSLLTFAFASLVTRTTTQKRTMTGGARAVRYIGRLLAVVIGVAVLVLIPRFFETPLMAPRAYLCLLPIPLILIILYIFEYLAQRNED